jgi:hypothetical protein
MSYLVAQVNRFGLAFEVRYNSSSPQAPLYMDGHLVAWLAVGQQGTEVFFDMDDDQQVIPPASLGMRVGTKDVADNKFLLDAEEYVLARLATKLSTMVEELVPPEELDVDSNIAPHARGLRVAKALAEHGRPDLLPHLVATEIFSALEALGHNLADALDAHADEIEPEDCVEYVRSYVDDTLSNWRMLETEES